ncbi:MAG: alpha-amylase family glycosyl hydrolase, partial [Planctomycetota bacterium]
TWNINSIRARIDTFAKMVRKARPDVILLQETRCGDDVFPMPWNAHWYRAAPGEEKEHRRRNNVGPDHVWDPVFPHDNLFHWVWNRRYGGDLQGVVEKLDELQALGVTAIYFNPIFEGESMHKYDATDFRHIDDNFGTPAESGRVPQDFTPPASNTDDPMTWTWTAADRYFVDVLIPEAHKRGIRVVIDGVFNHTGRDFWAFEDVVANGTDSPYADWFFAEFDDDGALESWVAWDGPSGWLPKFMQKPNRDLVDPVKKHMFDITTRWMDPNGDGDPSDGIDGWRLDVALDVGLPFWEDWRAHVKSINPDAIIIAEIWSEADQYLQGQHFDTQMHYPFASAVVDWLAVQPGMSSDELGSRLQDAFNESPQTNLIHQNLFASHDTDRYVSMLYNPNRGYDQGNRIQDGDDYKDTRPSRDIYDLSLLGVAIQATYLGAPMIYYGDEYGMWGADDPTDRKPVPWPDTPRNLNPDDRADLRIRSAYREWFNLRHDPRIGPVLRYGDVQHVSTGDPGVFAFDRSLNGRAVRVIVNRNDRAYDATHLLPDGSRGKRMAPVSARWWVISGD